MAHRIHEGFLDDPRLYSACEQFWDELVASVTDQLGQRGKWRRWIPQTYANGMPIERDGNPIFDGRSDDLDRAFRIIQHAAVSDEVELAAWVKSYEEEYEELPRDELVFNLSLSEESATLAAELLRKWMLPATSAQDMRAFIAERLPHT
jgi:hypothetical protein